MKYVLHKLLILEHDQVRLLFSKDTFTRFQFYDKGVINCGKNCRILFHIALRLLSSSFFLTEETVVLGSKRRGRKKGQKARG